MSKAELDFTRSYTEEEFLALDTDHRIELIDGKLIVSPTANSPHQQISVALINALQPVARSVEALVYPTMTVRLTTGRIVIPDIIVADPDDENATAFRPHEVLLACEITSPGNAGHDRIRKMHLYAEAHIPWYLLVEPGFPHYNSVTLLLHRLEGDRYVQHTTATDRDHLIMEEPFPLKIRPADLYAWRRRRA